MQTANADLVLTGTNTPNPAVYWRGQPVPVQAIQVKHRIVSDVSLRVPAAPDLDAVCAELAAAGVYIERGE